VYSLQQFFSYVPLTEMVTRVQGGIPKLLPEGFYNLTKDVPGDRFRRTTFRGTRQLSRVTKYGSPPRNRQRVGRGTEDRVMLHTIEQIQAAHELLLLIRKWDDYVAQQMARDLIQQDTVEFARLTENLRTAAITASLAFGKIWFDSDGYLQLTSTNADIELDYGVASTHANQVNLGSGNIITDSWDDPTSDIPTMVLNLKQAARQINGYETKYAFYGKNVAGYLARNDAFRDYLARNPSYNQQYVNTGQIAPGTLDLTWVPVQDSFYDTMSDVVTEIFPADQVTFYPEVSRATYELAQGGYPVPKSFAVAPDLEGVASQMDYVFGPFQYAYMMPGHFMINMARGDTFLPDHKIPDSIFLVDTAF
jgi:hypothetical protein